ncbi:equilibrative nucleoside transporter, putative [Perkinsus marinus ATCC 50983]|uniref:Equilibrative nucleoside transporter, putative n=2 Tax=Perkinsus marinus (strain ATCC 50983 / TXsc) TaxID=423536 RepID=C5KS92_PERM5|nr:equilibrative nucleoside transporter, putative [Perkinsus marinus ATCC 50983]EER12673.1 equilibrative nucleoside transporter, putative [Perkinsus marinus ATCC 50983]|eukprot:XP_002780878.1 equilibrative nucleoside transporter, putative [Perkinsus marinus ATCC 50983]
MSSTESSRSPASKDDSLVDMEEARSFKTEEEKKSEPKVDWSLLAQFLILGFVALAPWNFVLADLPYLDSKFHNHFSSTVPIIYSIAVNVAQLLLIWVGNKFSFAPRFDWGCAILAIFNILLAVVAMTIGDGNPCPDEGLGFGLALVCVFLLGFGHALMESSSFGLAALCPQSCMIADMTGEGVAGLVGWPINMLLQVIFDAGNVRRQPEWQCLVFFCVTSVITVFVIPMYRCVTSKHPYMREVLKIEEKRKTASLKTRQTRRPVVYIVKDILPMALCAWGTMGVTFVVFPAQVSYWKSEDPSNTDFVAQVIYTFQVVDTIGRFAPSLKFDMPEWCLMIWVIARLIYIPLFICVSLYPMLVPFYYDWFKHLIMGCFAITNGCGCTLSMMKGPTHAQGSSEEEVSGYVMAFGLISGILSGSVFGLIANICLGQSTA